MTTDLTPPPDEPLDPLTRARLREQVVAGIAQPESRGRWAVPVAAAAAVVLVASVAGYAALRPGTDRSESVPAGAPASSPATAAPDLDDAPPEGSEGNDRRGGRYYYDPATGELIPYDGDVEPGTQGLDGSGPLPDTAPLSCRSEIRPFLQDAEPVLEFADGAVQGIFFVAGDRWTLCERNPETTTIQGSGRLAATYAEDDATPWQVSTNIVDVRPRSMVQIFTAGGPLPDGVTGIEYAFPDGSVQPAEIANDDAGRTWWRMEYVAQEGVLADPRQNQTELDQIEVTISLSGQQFTVPLAWGLDTCAQLNHGC